MSSLDGENVLAYVWKDEWGLSSNLEGVLMALPNLERLVTSVGVSDTDVGGTGSVDGWIVSLLSSTVGSSVGACVGLSMALSISSDSQLSNDIGSSHGSTKRGGILDQ